MLKISVDECFLFPPMVQAMWHVRVREGGGVKQLVVTGINCWLCRMGMDDKLHGIVSYFTINKIYTCFKTTFLIEGFQIEHEQRRYTWNNAAHYKTLTFFVYKYKYMDIMNILFAFKRRKLGKYYQSHALPINPCFYIWYDKEALIGINKLNL